MSSDKSRRKIYDDARSSSYEYCVEYLDAMKKNLRFRRMEDCQFASIFNEFVSRNYIEDCHLSLSAKSNGNFPEMVSKYSGSARGIMDAYIDFNNNGDLHSKKKK